MRLCNSYLCFIVYMLFICTHRSCGQTYDNMTTLISTLLSGYNSDVRPVAVQSSTVHVNVSMVLYNLLEVNTVRGVLTIIMSLPCSWYDEKITWNSSDYGGITSIKIQQQYVWTPPLMTTKPVEFTSIGQKWMKVTYQSNGFADWRPGDAYKFSCEINIKHWPFDEQLCYLSYFAIDHIDSEVLLQPDKLYTAFLVENGEWSLESTSVSTSTEYGTTEIIFILKLKRRVAFYIATLILPLICLSSLSCFVFLLPSESGERVGYCITILLSITVFLDVISDEVPKLSNPVPVLCQFMLIGVIMGSITTILVVLNLWIYHRSEKVPIGKFYKFIVKLARFKRTNSVAVGNNQQGQDELIIDTKMSKLINTGKALLGKTEPCDSDTAKGSTSEETLGGDNYREECGVTWQDVSIAFDRILFVVLGVVSAVYVPVMLLMLALRL